MKAATPTEMPLVDLVTALLIWAYQPAPPGQSWAEAYQAGDYQKAADLLHPIVAELTLMFESHDPEPFRHLAVMYARGLGVGRDPVVACALAQMAGGALHMLAPRFADSPLAFQTAIAESEQFQGELCGPLSNEERMAAGHAMGCYAFGMPEEVLTVGEHSVRVGRRGIALADDGDEKLRGLLDCPLIVARVRVTALQPPDDAAPGVKARHFLEMFSWHGGWNPRDGRAMYELRWHVYEMRDDTLEMVGMWPLDAASIWPRPALPADLDARLTLEMIRSGHVRWRLDGAPPKRGWIMLAEGKPR